MMSIEYIKALGHDRGLEAKALGLEPLVIDYQDSEFEERLRSIPNLGDYVPDGWEEITRYFVDATGYGAPDESAMTASQFVQTARQVLGGKELLGIDDREYGWGIVEQGQFQVYVGLFKTI